MTERAGDNTGEMALIVTRSDDVRPGWGVHVPALCLWATVLAATLWKSIVIFPAISAALAVALCTSGMAPRRTAVLASAIGWAVACTLSMLPPLFRSHYNEVLYARLSADAHPLELVLGLAVSVLLPAVLARKPWHPSAVRRAGFLLCALLLINFMNYAYILQSPLVANFDREPAAKGYNSDSIMWLRTIYLVRAGVPYYVAFKQALLDDTRYGSTTPTSQSVRLPFLIWAWATLPSPSWMLYLCDVFVMAVMVSMFWAVKDGVGWLRAVLCPAVIGAYYLYAATNGWIFFSDVWASLFLLEAFALWVRGREWMAIGWSLAACGMREFAALLPAVACVVSLVESRWKQSAAWGAALMVAVAANLLNYRLASAVLTNQKIGDVLHERFHLHFDFLWTVVRFGTILIAGRDVLVPMLVVLSLLLPLYLHRTPARVISLFVGAHLILFCTVGTAEAQYYAFNYLPIAIVGGAICLALICPDEEFRRPP